MASVQSVSPSIPTSQIKSSKVPSFQKAAPTLLGAEARYEPSNFNATKDDFYQGQVDLAPKSYHKIGNESCSAKMMRKAAPPAVIVIAILKTIGLLVEAISRGVTKQSFAKIEFPIEPKIAANLAEHVYEPDLPVALGYKMLSYEEVSKMFGVNLKDLQNAKAQVYQGEGERQNIVIAFPGSALPFSKNREHAHAFGNNIGQAMGFRPNNYAAAKAIGKQVGKNSPPDTSVTIVGHSQGGGMATVAGAWAAKSRPIHVMTFNTAVVNRRNLPRTNLLGRKSLAIQNNFVNEGDQLHKVNRLNKLPRAFFDVEHGTTHHVSGEGGKGHSIKSTAQNVAAWQVSFDELYGQGKIKTERLS